MRLRSTACAGGLALLVVLSCSSSLAGQSPVARSTWDGVYTAEQAGRGEASYMHECVTCHGEELGGVDAAPALVGGGFKSKWDGVALSDMLERIRISMPASDPGKLSRRAVADVLAFIFSANEFPVGGAELPSQSTQLRAIAFKARR